jgi:TatD DNase family protein
VPFRGKRNEPSYVRYTAHKVAEIKEIPFEKVAEVTSENALRVFRLL